jgi:hypothetical protein
LAELTARVQALEQRVKAMLAGLLLVAVLAVLSPLLAHVFLPSDREDAVVDDHNASPIPASLQPTAQTK